MPTHRIAKRAGTLLASAGASPNTSGLVVDTSDAINAIRSANPNVIKVSHDGSTIVQLLDGTWGSKTIVDGSATSLADIACPSNTMSGGSLFYLVEASDGTDFQAMSGLVTYAMVNKAGTNTLTITNATGNDAKAVSSGTLTLSWTFVTGTNKGTIKLTPTGSLTETTYRVTFWLTPVRGAFTLL